MAKVTVTGTGSTRRTRRSFNATIPLEQERIIHEMMAWADLGDPFLAKLDGIERVSKALLGSAHIPHGLKALYGPIPEGIDEDAPEGYALRALNRLHFLRKFLQEGNARVASDFAFDLGFLLAEAAMKPLADKAFNAAIGRARADARGDARRQTRNEELRVAYETMRASGKPRKAAIEDLKAAFNLSARSIRSVIPPARNRK